MDTMTYSAFRESLAGTLDKIHDDHKPVLVTRQKGKPCVVMSLEDFQAYEETMYLMQSPKNAQRLNEAMAEIEQGNSQEQGLIEE